MDAKFKQLLSNTIIFAVGNVLVKIISFVLMPLYTSVLTTSQYGVAELLNNSIEIVLPIVSLCIIEALFRFSIDKESNHKVLFMNSLIIILIGDVLVSVCCFVSYSLFNYKYALYFLLLYVTTTFYKLTIQFARGLSHIKRYALYGVLNSVILVISNVVLLVCFHGDVGSYLLSFSIGYGITGVIAFVFSKEYQYFSLNSFSKSKLEEMLKYSFPSIPNMLSWWVNSLSDRYIILWVCGSGLAGLYTSASKLPALINIVSSIFQQAWQYSTASEIKNRDSNLFFSEVFRMFSYICVIVCALLIVVNKMLCKVLLQSAFYSAWRFVPVLLLAATFGCIGTYFGTFYNALKDNRMLMYSTTIGALFNFVLNVCLIPYIGGMGAAIATAVSYFIIMLIRIIDVIKKIHINIEYLKVSIQFLLLFISTVFGCLVGCISYIVPGIIFVLILITDYSLFSSLIKMMVRLLKRMLSIEKT